MTSPPRTFLPFLVALAILLAPSAASAEEPDNRILAMSATLGGKASWAGVEMEWILSPYVRVGAGTGLALETPTISGHVSWYPMGAEKNGLYVDAGVDFFTTPECCGGPEVGGSAEKLLILPDLGLGWAHQNGHLLFKAGVDLIWGEGMIVPVPIPGLRVGFQI